MVKVTGPCYSISASGTIADAITYASWKGIPYAREWFTPANPQSDEQVNMRLALKIALVYWQVGVGDPTKASFNVGAQGMGMSGFNLFMKRALDTYITDHGVAVVPISVTVANQYPDDVFTWVV